MQPFPKKLLLPAFILCVILGSDAAAQQNTIDSAQDQANGVQPSVTQEEPKPELERPTVWGEPTEVQVGIYVIDIDEVDSADQSFAASVYFEAHWNNELLSHEGPGPKLRSLTDVWNPRLTIVGQQMMWRSYPDYVEIQPDGTVIYRQKIWGRFSQPLNLKDFPSDRQELSIHLVAAGLLENDVKMVPLGYRERDTVRHCSQVLPTGFRRPGLGGGRPAVLPSGRSSRSRRLRNENRHCSATDLLHPEGHHSSLFDRRDVVVAAVDQSQGNGHQHRNLNVRISHARCLPVCDHRPSATRLVRDADGQIHFVVDVDRLCRADPIDLEHRHDREAEKEHGRKGLANGRESSIRCCSSWSSCIRLSFRDKICSTPHSVLRVEH